MANFPHQPSPYDSRHRPIAEILQQLNNAGNVVSTNANEQRLTAANVQLQQQNQSLNTQLVRYSEAYSNLRHTNQETAAENTELKSILGKIAQALGVGNLISSLPIDQQGNAIIQAIHSIQADANQLHAAAQDAAHIPTWTSNPLAEGDEGDDGLDLIAQYGLASPLHSLASQRHHDDLRDQGQHRQTNHSNNAAWVNDGSAQLGASYELFAQRGATPNAPRSGNRAFLSLSSTDGWQQQQR